MADGGIGIARVGAAGAHRDLRVAGDGAIGIVRVGAATSGVGGGFPTSAATSNFARRRRRRRTAALTEAGLVVAGVHFVDNARAGCAASTFVPSSHPLATL